MNQPIPTRSREGKIQVWNKTEKPLFLCFSNSQINLTRYNTSNANSDSLSITSGAGGGGISRTSSQSNAIGASYAIQPIGVVGPYDVPNIGNVPGDADNGFVYNGADTKDPTTGKFQRTYMTVFVNRKPAVLNLPVRGGNTFDFETDGTILFRESCGSWENSNAIGRWDDEAVFENIQLMGTIPEGYRMV